MAYLQSLSGSERDALLKSIIYVEDPSADGGCDGFQKIKIDGGGSNYVVNYSELFTSLGKLIKVPKEGKGLAVAKLPSPESLRNGDSIQFGDYRGCGTYYVTWLKKGLISNNNAFTVKFKGSCEEWLDGMTESGKRNLEDEDEEDDDEIANKRAKLNEDEENQHITFVSREADGPHNDGLHDCYLTLHADEYGYGPSTVFSSAPIDYFEHLEGEVVIFDPLLTHSQSNWGEEIQTAKKSKKWSKKADFPYNYYGYYNSHVQEEVEWYSLKKKDRTATQILAVRKLLNDHFKPDGWVSTTDDVVVITPNENDDAEEVENEPEEEENEQEEEGNEEDGEEEVENTGEEEDEEQGNEESGDNDEEEA